MDEVFEKDRESRRENRKNRAKKIKARVKLVENVGSRLQETEIIEGQFANSGEVAKHLTGGCSVKTKAKDSHASYRHKGAYGPGKNYSPRDKRQMIEDEDA